MSCLLKTGHLASEKSNTDADTPHSSKKGISRISRLLVMIDRQRAVFNEIKLYVLLNTYPLIARLAFERFTSQHFCSFQLLCYVFLEKQCTVKAEVSDRQGLHYFFT